MEDQPSSLRQTRPRLATRGNVWKQRTRSGSDWKSHLCGTVGAAQFRRPAPAGRARLDIHGELVFRRVVSGTVADVRSKRIW